MADLQMKDPNDALSKWYFRTSDSPRITNAAGSNQIVDNALLAFRERLNDTSGDPDVIKEQEACKADPELMAAYAAAEAAEAAREAANKDVNGQTVMKPDPVVVAPAAPAAPVASTPAPVAAEPSTPAPAVTALGTVHGVAANGEAVVTHTVTAIDAHEAHGILATIEHKVITGAHWSADEWHKALAHLRAMIGRPKA
jgi:hypothetical protein